MASSTPNLCAVRPARLAFSSSSAIIASTKTDSGPVSLPDNLRHTLSSVLTTTRVFFTQVSSTLRNARVELIQAAAARALVVLLLNPVDVVKVRVQTSALTASKALSAFCLAQPPLTGLVPSLVSHAARLTITYSLFSVLYDRMSNPGATPTKSRSDRRITLLAACVADTLSALAVSPLEVLKVRVQSGMSRSLGAAWQQGGVFQQGLSTQVLRDLPFRVLFLVAFDIVRRRHAERTAGDGGKDSTGVGLSLGKGAVAAGAIAASVAAVTTPVDVVRSRIMAQHPSHGRLYANWAHCVTRTVAREGPSALFRGVVPRMVYMAISASLFVVVADRVKKVTDDKLCEIASTKASTTKNDNRY